MAIVYSIIWIKKILTIMRVPIRKGGKYTFTKPDPYLTQEKFDALQSKLDKLLNYTRLQAMADVKRTGENGDFSENAEYQIAKGRLRGINQRILDLQDQLKNVHIIKPNKNANTIGLGNKATVLLNGQEKTFQILGSAETNPALGIISHKSPIGSALIGHQVGEMVKIKINNHEITYKILDIK